MTVSTRHLRVVLEVKDRELKSGALRFIIGHLGTYFLRTEYPFTVIDLSKGKIGMVVGTRPSKKEAVDLSCSNNTHMGGRLTVILGIGLTDTHSITLFWPHCQARSADH